MLLESHNPNNWKQDQMREIARQEVELEFVVVGFFRLFLFRNRWLWLGNCRH